AMAAMHDRDPVRGAQTMKIPALHGALETLALAGAHDVDHLALDEVVGRDFRTYLDQVLRADAELGKLALGFDLGNRKALPRRPREPAGLAPARAQLQGTIAVLLVRSVGKHLNVLELQHRHGDMLPGLGEDSGHADLLRYDTGTHVVRIPSLLLC